MLPFFCHQNIGHRELGVGAGLWSLEFGIRYLFFGVWILSFGIWNFFFGISPFGFGLYLFGIFLDTGRKKAPVKTGALAERCSIVFVYSIFSISCCSQSQPTILLSLLIPETIVTSIVQRTS
jgi:hypothetical protein